MFEYENHNIQKGCEVAERITNLVTGGGWEKNTVNPHLSQSITRFLGKKNVS